MFFIILGLPGANLTSHFSKLQLVPPLFSELKRAIGGGQVDGIALIAANVLAAAFLRFALPPF